MNLIKLNLKVNFWISQQECKNVSSLIQIANRFPSQVLKFTISLIMGVTGIRLKCKWILLNDWGQDGKRCWQYSQVSRADVDHVTSSTTSANETAECTVGCFQILEYSIRFEVRIYCFNKFKFIKLIFLNRYICDCEKSTSFLIKSPKSLASTQSSRISENAWRMFFVMPHTTSSNHLSPQQGRDCILRTVHDVINRHIIEEACRAVQISEKIKEWTEWKTII